MTITQAPPPIYVTVQPAGIPTWLQVATLLVALLALFVSGLQFVLNRQHQKQSRPNIRCSVSFTDKLHTGRGMRKVAILHVANLGAEATKLKFFDISTDRMLINGFNSLLDDDGTKTTNNEHTRTIDSYSSESFYVDAHQIEDNEIEVFASFGHGVTISSVVTLNQRTEVQTVISKSKHWYTPWRKAPQSRTWPKERSR